MEPGEVDLLKPSFIITEWKWIGDEFLFLVDRGWGIAICFFCRCFLKPLQLDFRKHIMTKAKR